jgi:hypothetical protein
VEDQDEWNEVFSQICAKLITYNFTWLGDRIDNVGYDFLAPLANAKNLTTLKLRGIPSSETFRQRQETLDLPYLPLLRDNLKKQNIRLLGQKR